jgi:hypothetical protein
MQLRSLKELLRAVQALVTPERITVLGSSALLATDARLGEAGEPLEISFDADLLLDPSDEEVAAIVHEAVGEGSLFHKRNAVYADVLRPEIVDTLPTGWDQRLKPIPDVSRAAGLEAHDLALVKLALGRSKDLDLLRTLLKRGTIQADELQRRFQCLTWTEHRLRDTGLRLRTLLADQP